MRNLKVLQMASDNRIGTLQELHYLITSSKL